MEKIPTNPTGRDNELFCGGCMGGPPYPQDTTHCRGKERERGKKKEREGKKEQTPARCSNAELWRGIGEMGTSIPAARGRAEGA